MLVDSLFEITHVPHSIHITRGGMDLVAHHTISMSQPDNSVTNQIAECYTREYQMCSVFILVVLYH